MSHRRLTGAFLLHPSPEFAFQVGLNFAAYNNNLSGGAWPSVCLNVVAGTAVGGLSPGTNITQGFSYGTYGTNIRPLCIDSFNPSPNYASVRESFTGLVYAGESVGVFISTNNVAAGYTGGIVLTQATTQYYAEMYFNQYFSGQWIAAS